MVELSGLEIGLADKTSMSKSKSESLGFKSKSKSFKCKCKCKSSKNGLKSGPKSKSGLEYYKSALWCGSSLVPTRWLQATSTEQSCRGSGRCGYRRGIKEVKVQQPVYTVRLDADCSRDFWSHRRIGDRPLPAARTPHWNNDCWEALICILMQRLSVVIEHGNAICVAGTSPSSEDLDMDT